MCVPAPTDTPTTALISAGVRSGQASLGGAAAADGAAAAETMKMAAMIAPWTFFECMGASFAGTTQQTNPGF
jgi:hypothetical protein